MSEQHTLHHKTEGPETGGSQAIVAFLTIVAGTVLGLAGIDLVLPSVPAMPQIFATDTATAQLVLATYVAGMSLGLLMFGALASHFGRRRLFIGSLAVFGVLSLLAVMTDDIHTLNVIRFFQGAAASGGAVLAPGLIRALFSDLGAIRAVSAMGSIESLVPGLAPIAGAWLFDAYGWEASFKITGVLVLAICALVLIKPSLLPHIGQKRSGTPSSYWRVMKNRAFIRYGLSHALILGGLLVFVFSTPAVVIETMDGVIEDFIRMQFVGVCLFIVSANINGSLVKRFGNEPVIMAGTVLSLVGCVGLFAYGLFGPNDPYNLVYLFWVLNLGHGIRSGPGFVRALQTTHGEDDRASALIILATMLIAAVGTAVVAPFIKFGLAALTFALVLIVLPALVLMVVFPPFTEGGQPAQKN
ncbi:MFS transporter [Kordiimonas aestuarii]|uniref:MFS transporter n=1 Tax=Kordiimonas aestuarii TaxID=1005925 RepID=UPI0021CFAAF3|nr:MFS transporter [Kordiimonas aestuarii]